jgi:amino acid transporter
MSAEARSQKSLAWTSRWMSYLAVLVVFILALVEYLNVGWGDTRLPGTWFRYSREQQHSTVLSVLAAQDYTSHILPGLVTGCLIYTTISTSNTVLYVASRALYGVFRSIPPSVPPLALPLERFVKLGSSRRRDGLPGWAIIVSVLSFWWLPFTTLSSGDSVKDVSHTLRSHLMSRSCGKSH